MSKRLPRRSNQAITMKDVAARAGVSTMTVSNVLNGRANVQKIKQDAVIKAVEELGYAPNLEARALACAGSSRIGLLYKNPQSAFLSSLLVGALNATMRHGAQLILRKCDTSDPNLIVEAINAVIRSGANAILIPAPLSEIVTLSDLKGIKAPMMALAAGEGLDTIPGVRVDDAAASEAMTNFLIEKGHQRIALIQGPAEHGSSAARLSGYKRALANANIPLVPDFIARGDFSFNSGLSAAEALLDLPEPPTAIFASNDDMAAAVVSIAHRRGLHVPKQLSVAGFDDTPIATKIWPPLTTVHQPTEEMAELATSRLTHIIANGPKGLDALETLYVPFEIVERESTAAPEHQSRPDSSVA